MSAATMPTKNAARSSTPSMKRSIRLARLTPSAGFTSVAGMIPRVSVRGLILSERLLELFHDGAGIAAGLAHVVDPLFLQRLGRPLPFLELRVGDRIDPVARLRLHLGQPRVVEIRPWAGGFSGPPRGGGGRGDLLFRQPPFPVSA